MPKCDFNKFALLHIFRTHFPKNTSWGLLLIWHFVWYSYSSPTDTQRWHTRFLNLLGSTPVFLSKTSECATNAQLTKNTPIMEWDSTHCCVTYQDKYQCHLQKTLKTTSWDLENQPVRTDIDQYLRVRTILRSNIYWWWWILHFLVVFPAGTNIRDSHYHKSLTCQAGLEPDKILISDFAE